ADRPRARPAGRRRRIHDQAVQPARSRAARADDSRRTRRRPRRLKRTLQDSMMLSAQALAERLQFFWDGPDDLPRTLKLEWRFVAVRWLRFAVLFHSLHRHPGRGHALRLWPLARRGAAVRER